MNLPLFNHLETLYPQRLPDSEDYASVTAALLSEFSGDNVTAESRSVSRYHFRAAMMIYLGVALAATLLSLFHPLAGLILTSLIWLAVSREFYRPLLAKLFVDHGQNLYFTLPARSKETQKLIVTATYATDEPFPRSKTVSTPNYLFILSLLFLVIALINGLTYLTGISGYAYFALLPGAAIWYWSGFKSKKLPATESGSLRYLTVLSELQTLLLKARPLSTTVTFVLLGVRAMNSGALDLLRQIRTGPKLTYVVNLTQLTDPADAASLTTTAIVTSEGRWIKKNSDPNLVELLRMVADEKNLTVITTKVADHLEVFPLLLQENQAVSVGIPRNCDLNTNRDLRELLAGLIRKLEH